MIIRKGTLEDLKKVKHLVASFFNESVGKYGFECNDESLLVLMRTLQPNSFVIEKDNKVIGVIAGSIETAMATNDKMFHEIIWYVDKIHRRYGIKLLRHCEKYYKENGIKFIIMCNMGNLNDEKLERFYTKMGYNLFEKQYIKELC